jgi:hypothetical protein
LVIGQVKRSANVRKRFVGSLARPASHGQTLAAAIASAMFKNELEGTRGWAAVSLGFMAMVILLTCCGRTIVTEGNDQWHHQLKMFGLPNFQTFAEAMTFFTNSTNVAASSVLLCGGEMPFPIVLKCGATTDSQHVDTLAGLIFAPFEKESIPTFIEMLDHDDLYIRYAADKRLHQKIRRYDQGYDFRASKQQRQAAVQRWRDWWKANAENSRLDNPPRGCLEAAEWEQQK